MTSSKFDLMLSDYNPFIDQQKKQLLKKKKKYYLYLLTVCLICLIFLISAISLGINNHNLNSDISDIDQMILMAQRQLSYRNISKTLNLTDCGVQFFQLSSLGGSQKKIKIIDLTNHKLIRLYNIYIEDVEQLFLQSTPTNNTQNNLQDLSLFQLSGCYLPKLKKIKINNYFMMVGNYLGIEQFPEFIIVPQIGDNILPYLKSIKFEDVELNNFHNNELPLVEEASFINTSSFYVQITSAPKLKILSINDSNNVLQAFNLANNDQLQTLQVTSTNFIQISLYNVSRPSQLKFKVPRIKRFMLVNSSFIDLNTTYKQISSVHMEKNYDIQTFDLSNFPKLNNLFISQTSLKYLIKSDFMKVDNISIINIKQSSLQSFTNMTLRTLNLELGQNINLTEFSYIQSLFMYQLQLPPSIIRINNNYLYLLQQIQKLQTQNQYINLELFSNNNLQNVDKLNLSHSKLSKFDGNQFARLSLLDLSNCQLNDTSAIKLLESNIFLIPQNLKIIDLSNNPIKDKEELRLKLKGYFLNAKITV